MLNPLEVMILVLLALMAVPDFMKRLGRPGLVFVVYVLLGVAAGWAFDEAALSLLHNSGKFGFILLLFNIGLEIDLPHWRNMVGPFWRAAVWYGYQLVILSGLAWLCGIDLAVALIIGGTLSAVSISLSYSNWKHYPGLSDKDRQDTLSVMVVMEILAIFAVVFAESLSHVSHEGGGRVLWDMVVVLGVCIVIYVVADRLTSALKLVLEKTIRWKAHFLVLLILAFAAIGERMGFSAPKVAFFLGLFISSTTREGLALEHHLAPISERFLIPIFFVGLGAMIPVEVVFTKVGVFAFALAVAMVGLRKIVQQRTLFLGGDAGLYLLVCPNLTMGAVGFSALHHMNAPKEVSIGYLLVSLFMSLLAVFSFPKTETKHS